MNLLLAILIVFVVLCTNELWWRKHAIHTELSRKFAHIIIGSFVAFWPYFLSWHQIELLSVAFILVVSISKYLRVFQAIHSVQRPTWGEFCFALAVGAIALITHNKLIYATALLQMSLADGLAAVVGTQYGRAHRYLVFGHTKSVLGTQTFFVVSMLVLYGFSMQSPTHVDPLSMVGMAFGASVIENIGVQGLDNLLVPLFIATMLRLAF